MRKPPEKPWAWEAHQRGLSHDIYANILRWGKVNERTEVLISRTATLELGVVAILVLGHAQPIFRLDSPTLVALPLASVVCIVVSLLDRSRRAEIDRAGYVEYGCRMNGGAVLAAAE